MIKNNDANAIYYDTILDLKGSLNNAFNGTNFFLQQQLHFVSSVASETSGSAFSSKKAIFPITQFDITTVSPSYTPIIYHHHQKA